MTAANWTGWNPQRIDYEHSGGGRGAPAWLHRAAGDGVGAGEEDRWTLTGRRGGSWWRRQWRQWRRAASWACARRFPTRPMRDASPRPCSSDRVPEALAEARGQGPPAREALVAAAARAKQPEPALAIPGRREPRSPRFISRRRRALAQGMAALVADARGPPRASRRPRRSSPSAPSPVEDAQGIGILLGLAELAEGYLKAHRESRRDAVSLRLPDGAIGLAFERQASAKALEGQKASAKKHRAFRLRPWRRREPAGQGGRRRHRRPALPQRPAPDHPRNFDPDACCRDK